MYDKEVVDNYTKHYGELPEGMIIKINARVLAVLFKEIQSLRQRVKQLEDSKQPLDVYGLRQ